MRIFSEETSLKGDTDVRRNVRNYVYNDTDFHLDWISKTQNWVRRKGLVLWGLQFGVTEAEKDDLLLWGRWSRNESWVFSTPLRHEHRCQLIIQFTSVAEVHKCKRILNLASYLHLYTRTNTPYSLEHNTIM
jgi:hypothetical protein